MPQTTYDLLHPVEIALPRPPRADDEAPATVRKTVRTIPLRPVSARMYLDLGDVSILATTPTGGSYEIELDDKIRAYLDRRIDDPKDPEPGLARKALVMADAMALRADTIDAIDVATNRAWQARQGADPESVTLLDPVEVHGERVTAVALKWPTGADFDRLGQPYLKSRLGDGSTQLVERTDVIAKYIGRSIDHETGSMLLGLLGLADVIQIKMAVTSFFTRAVGEVNGARRSMLSSSAESTSPSATPAA